jgi:hypothetical protein
MRGEGEGPSSSSGTATMNPPGHIATRIFSTPSVPPETDSMPSRGDATPPQHTPDHAGGVHDHGTDHSSLIVTQVLHVSKAQEQPWYHFWSNRTWFL